VDRESLPSDVDPLALRPALVELCRALDSLRERLGRREQAPAQSGALALDLGGTPADADARALGIVQELLSIPSAGLPPTELFTLAMDRASRLLAADRAMLFVAEAGGSRLVARAAHGFRREDLGSTAVRAGEGIIGRAFKERRVLAHPAATDEPSDAFLERFPVREAIAVPVRVEGDVAGVLYVGRRRPHAPFGASDILLLLVIADRVGGGLVHQALLRRQAAETARLAELGRLAGQLLSVRPLGEVLAAACEVGCRLADVPAAAVAIALGPDELELSAARGLPPTADTRERVSTRGGVTAELYAGEDLVVCRDVQARRAPERSFLADAGFRGCLLLPLRVQDGAAVGVLYLADTRVRDFSDEEIEAARVLATMVTWAIGDRRAGRDVHDAPRTDSRGTSDQAAQLETARVIGEMASGLARELNDIFAIILGKSRLLLARTTSEPVREGLAMLEEAAWRGADVVHRLMALAAPAAGEAAGPVDMAGLVRDVIAVMRPRWKDEQEGPGAGIDVVADLQSVPPVQGSESALREMLVNLVVNAVDAMPPGGQLTLSTRPIESGVELVIEDTGEGISEDARGRVFDAFFTTRSPKRMGLGLTVAHGVIVRHGGRIDISSAPQRGTRVTVWLPGMNVAASASPASVRGTASDSGAAPVAETGRQMRVRATTDARTEPRRALGAPPPDGPAATLRPPDEARTRSPVTGERSESRAASILVLEDESSVRALLVEALTQAGYKVEAAVDGLSGLAKLDAGPFDVVVTDLALPQRSGLAIARAVKRLSPPTPVVLITGWGQLLDPDRLREHGVDFILVKPFRTERVLSVVSDALHLRSGS
jgi:signal transduction histidine kinase/CheY-like chemotaxis protein